MPAILFWNSTLPYHIPQVKRITQQTCYATYEWIRMQNYSSKIVEISSQLHFNSLLKLQTYPKGNWSSLTPRIPMKPLKKKFGRVRKSYDALCRLNHQLLECHLLTPVIYRKKLQALVFAHLSNSVCIATTKETNPFSQITKLRLQFTQVNTEDVRPTF